MSLLIPSGDGADTDTGDDREPLDDGATSDQVMHAQDESKAEGDRDEPTD